jgi:glutamyl-tRNA reductase
VAVELARGALGELHSRRVLVIGAGENGELTAKALRERGVETVFVANRRYDRAIGLAQRFGGHAVRFDDLPGELLEADIVVSSTASPHQIVGREELELVMEGRGGRPLLLIDTAVPRDIDPTVRELSGITLFDMDDVQREVARGLNARAAEVVHVRTIVEQEVERFGDWLASLDVVPTIAALRERGEEIVQRVLRENDQRWESLSEDDRARVELLARTVVGRLLHEPTLRMKGAAERGGSYVHLQALRELFGLDPEARELGLDDDERAPADIASLDAHRRKAT